MHELSITRSMLDQALAEAGKHGARRINRIRLLLGEAGGVVPDCVRFYFDRMKEGTAAAEAELEFERVPLRIRCPKCGAEWGAGSSSPPPDHSTTGTLDHVLEGMCECNAGGEVVSGQELVIESIDVD
jgi:hydrogenase nickel insertion protein HypA